MIATLPGGRSGTGLRASQAVMSRAVTRLRVPGGPAVSPPLNIDGGVGLSADRRRGLPVVLLPLLAECSDAAGRIINAVYSLQQASLEFRVVVITDMASFKELRPFGWAIAHLQPEAAWRGEGFWLGYAEAECESVSAAFGCSLVVETSEAGISEKSWRNLLAVSRMGFDLPNTSERGAPDPGGAQVHGSWRGWMNGVPAGSSTHGVVCDGNEWILNIRKNPKSSMVLLRLGQPAGEASSALPQDVGSEWNVVEMHMPPGVRPRISEGLGGVLAVFDALSLDNCGIVESPEHLPVDFRSALPYVIATHAVSESNVQAAYRRALSVWSSRGM